MHAADRFTTPASAVRFEKDSVILDDDPQTGVPQIIDLAATYAAASDTLPFTPDELIAKAKAVLLSEYVHAASGGATRVCGISIDRHAPHPHLPDLAA